MPTWIISGVTSTDISSKGFTQISSTTGVVGSYGPINPSYKAGILNGVDFSIGYRTTPPTLQELTFINASQSGASYLAQLVPLGALNTYTVVFPQQSTVQGSPTTAGRVMAYVIQSDGAGNWSDNTYLSMDILGYTSPPPSPVNVSTLIANLKSIGIPVFDSTGALQ